MKIGYKIGLIIIILNITIQLFAYGKGAGFYAELGKDVYTNVSYTEIEVHYRFILWDFEIKPYGITKTWFLTKESDKIGVFRGNPFCDIYTAGLELKYDNLIFFYEHNCAHKVYSSYSIWQTEEYQISGNSDIIGVRYQYN